MMTLDYPDVSAVAFECACRLSAASFPRKRESISRVIAMAYMSLRLRGDDVAGKLTPADPIPAETLG